MVNFAQNRLQVFVSSTFSDLIHERQAAVEAILAAGHIPAGMELFASGDESQMEVIRQWIDESDVYLLILGGRYGSVDPHSDMGYTELEYDYAVARKKPLFACVINDRALEERIRNSGSSVLERSQPQKLMAFRNKVLTKMVRFWDDYKDIKIAIGEALPQISRREHLKGWVRSDAKTVDMVEELNRLARENDQLKSGKMGTPISQSLVANLRMDPYFQNTQSDITLVGINLTSLLGSYRERINEQLTNGRKLTVGIIDSNADNLNAATRRSDIAPARANYYKTKLETSIAELQQMADTAKRHGYKDSVSLFLLPYVPSFSIRAFDADQNHGCIVVEIYPHRTADSPPMFVLTPREDKYWFMYFRNQMTTMLSNGDRFDLFRDA